MKPLTSIAMALAALLSSCAFYHEKDPPSPSNVIPGTVTWSQVSAQVFQARCAICHSVGGAGFNSSSYDTVVAMIKQVEDRAITKQSMPADSPLTPYEIALLQAWINEGTPNDGGGP